MSDNLVRPWLVGDRHCDDPECESVTIEDSGRWVVVDGVSTEYAERIVRLVNVEPEIVEVLQRVERYMRGRETGPTGTRIGDRASILLGKLQP